MRLEVFDVEHGACALLTSDNGNCVLIDCGHNATTSWRPGDYLLGRGINRLEGLFITNYDEDHVSGLSNLLDRVHVNSIFRNPSVGTAQIRTLKSETGMGPGIDRLVNVLDNTYTLPAAPLDLGNVTLYPYWNTYPTFDDENNLSLVTFFKYGNHCVVFPGDMEEAGWRYLLHNSNFQNDLALVNVFVASHHGRESGICEAVFDYAKNIVFVVVSDKPIEHMTQETTEFYRSVARGADFNGVKRRVLTTRSDGKIDLYFR